MQDKNIKKELVKFIDRVVNKQYKSANSHLNNAISGKIKQKMINNNTTIF